MIPGRYVAQTYSYLPCQCTATCIGCQPRLTTEPLFIASYTDGCPGVPYDWDIEPLPKPRRDRPWYRDKETPRRREWWKR